MNLWVDLPNPVGDDLSREAEGDHVLPAEHARILLFLVWSLRKDHQDATSARAIKEYFRSRSLDPDLFVNVFEELVTLFLKSGCDTALIDANADLSVKELPPIEKLVQRTGQMRRPSAFGKYAHLGVSSEDVIREHQEDIEREERGWH